MKSATLLSSLLAAILSSGIGCAADPSAESSFPGTIKQEHSKALAGSQLCDVETPCPADLECMYIGALDLDGAICVDSATVCEALDCGDGECLVLESYPAQLMCSGSPDPGGDGDDSSCSISSDGSSDCPDSDGRSEPGAEPGNPGPG